MSFSCYTIDRGGVTEGIPADGFDCILSDSQDPVTSADLVIVPTLEGVPGTIENAQFGLAFLRRSPGRPTERGIIASVDLGAWAPASDNCRAALLYPCGRDDRTLLFLPADGRAVLRSTAAGKPAVLSVPEDGGAPLVTQPAAAETTLVALGLDANALFSAPPVSRKAAPKGRTAASRKTAGGAKAP